MTDTPDPEPAFKWRPHAIPPELSNEEAFAFIEARRDELRLQGDWLVYRAALADVTERIGDIDRKLYDLREAVTTLDHHAKNLGLHSP